MDGLCDRDRFDTACRLVCESARQSSGIGTLSERTLHAVIKKYIEPSDSLCEVKIGRSVADICRSDGIYEIQTRGFNRLCPKLDVFLRDYPVTVVYPIADTKRLIWTDPETGELTKPRKSPRRGNIYDAFYELYKLGALITHPNLRVLLLFIDIDEYRIRNGRRSRDGKRGSTRYERIPVSLNNAVMLKTDDDYISCLPMERDKPFTSDELAQRAGIPLGRAQTTLTVLKKRGIISASGKSGRYNLYTIKK